ncbi:hypothetical protein Pmani_024106 [Petrolisthes manimaculis]|uniref:Uncharacterized protein n=1 Tax=Petrolisthes manimaculis TaxID=1843537 RepID=A0AAE1TZN3_9EUCA|nr:hypothetical protein Pmani_024106 [Petrolisthes manimaculis]
MSTSPITNLDKYLLTVPDEPPVPSYTSFCRAPTNSLLDQLQVTQQFRDAVAGYGSQDNIKYQVSRYTQIPTHSLSGAFLTPQVPHTCRLPPGASPYIPTNNNTDLEFGRKRMLAISAFIYICLGNCISWLPGLEHILVFRFIMGFFHPAVIDAGFTLGWAYLFRDWRWTVFTCALPSFLFIPAIWSLDESPRWLIVRGHHDRALQVLQKASRWNNTSLVPEHQIRTIMDDILEESTNCKPVTRKGLLARLKHILHQYTILFSTRMMTRITLCVYVINFSLGTVYNGLSLGADIFTTNPYIYTVMSAVFEMPGNIFTVPIADYFGRRNPNMFFLFLNGLIIISITFIPSSLGWLLTTLALMGKLTISAAYQIYSLHSTELFPTEVRTRGTGTSSMLAKLGATVAPFIVDSMQSLWISTPYVVLGGVTIMSTFITYLLPETKGIPLNDTIAALTRAHTKKTYKENDNSTDELSLYIEKNDDKENDNSTNEPSMKNKECNQQED